MHPPKLGRRTFLKSLGGAFAASSLAGRPLYGSVGNRTPVIEEAGHISIPFHEPTDVLICGSTLFACQTALDCAKSGLKTTLVMDRVNPFFEGISCLLSWVNENDAADFPEVVRGVFSPSTSESRYGRTYFNASRAALEIEDRLTEAGVRFYYNCAVAGALGQGPQLAGVVFGGKTGFFAIEAARIIDATPEATVARAAGASCTPVNGARRFQYVVDLAASVSPRQVEYTASNGARVRADVHHFFATFEVSFTSNEQGPLAFSRDFERVYAATLEMPWSGSEKRFRGADGLLSSGQDRLQASNGALEAFPNLLIFGPMGIGDNLNGSLVLANWRSLFNAFPNALERVSKIPQRPLLEPVGFYKFWNKGVPVEHAAIEGAVHSFTDHGFDEPGTRSERLEFTPPAVAETSEVIVSGGGTSGNAAAYACASLGLKTLCLERGRELGGTNTVGGVTNLWYGNRTRAFNEYYEAMEAKNDGLNAPGFYRGVRKAGANVLFGVSLTGVVTQGRCVQRLYIATPMGLTAVESKHFIDATGDGSIAAWAGCGYSFGGEHDELTLWASFAGYKPGRAEALRPFLSPCDERSPTDTTRFILSMRRNSKISLEQPHVPPPFYLAPRESRHIRGGKTLTFLDLLAGRRFKDGVFRVESNPDIKGLATSDAAKAGFIPTNWKALYQATVPYAAMVPTGVDNVIIAGKAYSVTHDALSAARMQRDLCVMGMVAGNSVSLAKSRSVLLREIPVSELQATLISKGMLKASDIADDDFGFNLTPDQMAQKVASGSNMDGCLPESAMLCLVPREAALKALAPFVGNDTPALNRVLCFLGEPGGVIRYLAKAEALLNEAELSTELYGGTATKHLMPDQGYAPVSALMLGSLSHCREPRALPLLKKLSERIHFNPADLRAAWGYLFSLACGYERLACPEGRLPLLKVLADPLFNGCTVLRSGDLRQCSNIVSERLSYLQMALSRALLRCGDPEGATILCGFLNEARLCLARAARSELVAATGRDFGFDVPAWTQWLREHAGVIRPNPLTLSFG